jgi:PKD repeat protein
LITYDYGDGNFDNGLNNPTHVYAEEGVYITCQIIQDMNGNCFDVFCDTVFTENGTCSAGFDWFDSGLSVEFIGFSLGSYDSLSWEFGDGNSTGELDPIHTYATPGSYTACLSLYDQGVLCDSICETINVDTTGGGGGGLCIADFAADVAGLSVAFTNLSLGNYNTTLWDFGDQLGTSFQNNPTYIYSSAGTYEVCLLMLDSAGGACFDQYCMDVTVGGGGGGGACNADFSYETDGLSIDMEDESTGLYLTALWDYGDGGFPSFDPFYTYDEAGEYEVCLTIVNPFPFCTDTYCETVEIVELTCDASFDYSFDPATNAYSFSNTTTEGNVTSVEWEFGDGNSSTFANPTYNYNAPGVYEVCLSTFDEGNLCGFVCEDVEVYPLSIGEAFSSETRVFPNPNSGSFSIQGLPSDGGMVMLRDLAGRVVHQVRINSTSEALQLDVSSGTYLLEIQVNGNAYFHRLVIE